jgi:hypothetical protein
VGTRVWRWRGERVRKLELFLLLLVHIGSPLRVGKPVRIAHLEAFLATDGSIGQQIAAERVNVTESPPLATFDGTNGCARRRSRQAQL